MSIIIIVIMCYLFQRVTDDNAVQVEESVNVELSNPNGTDNHVQDDIDNTSEVEVSVNIMTMRSVLF